MKRVLLAVLFVGILNSPVLAGFQEGISAYEAGNLLLAVKEFRAAAQEGHADSQFNLGLMYEKGIGVGKDENEALTWYLKAALQGNAYAQFNLAVLYENGRGSDVDFAEAHQWYRRAAAQGDGLAVGNLGMLYLRGQGVEKDTVAGLALLLSSVSMDSSSENRAKQNISMIKGLTNEAITAARTLSLEMSKDENLLLPLDRYLKNKSAN